MSGSLMYWEISGRSVGRPRLSCSFITVDRSSQERGVANLGPSGVFSMDMSLPGLIV